MITLWDKNQEIDFFKKSLQIATPEQLFYVTKDGKYYAYWPKRYKGEKGTLQSRNAFIGSFTEKWCKDLFKNFATEVGGYAIRGVICEEIGLTKQSSADVVVCKEKNVIQRAKNILLIIEVKISVVWNWEMQMEGDRKEMVCIGNFRKHQGTPSLLRSDTMLKAIGKSINIRVSSYTASRIPIIIIGNTPITKMYYEKVDHLKRTGIIQGFWSVNPNPLDDNKEDIKSTSGLGFYRFDDITELRKETIKLLKEEREFFSGMTTKKQLGQIIELANKENTYEEKAQRFLELIRSTK